MALELMLSLLAHSDVSLANMLPINYFKCMSMSITLDCAETFLVVAALCPWISEL